VGQSPHRRCSKGPCKNRLPKDGRRAARLAGREEGEHALVFRPLSPVLGSAAHPHPGGDRRATQPGGMDRRPDWAGCSCTGPKERRAGQGPFCCTGTSTRRPGRYASLTHPSTRRNVCKVGLAPRGPRKRLFVTVHSPPGSTPGSARFGPGRLRVARCGITGTGGRRAPLRCPGPRGRPMTLGWGSERLRLFGAYGACPTTRALRTRHRGRQ